MILEHRIAVVGPRLFLILAIRSALVLCGLLYISRPSRCTGVANTCERTGVNICMAAILTAELENMESGIDEVNIGGRLIDPKIVIASRKRKVAPTILGN